MFRRLLSSFCLLALIGLATVRASAAAPVAFTEHSINVFCDEPLVGPAGAAQLFFAGFSSEFGASGDVAFWAGQTTPVGEPTLVTNFEGVAGGSASASSLSITIPLIDTATGEPDGVATVDAVLSRAGDPEPFEFRDRFGNHQIRESGTFQPMIVTSGALTIGGGSFSLVGCAGSIVELTHFETQPDSTTFHEQDMFAFCDLSAGETTGFLDVFADANGTYAELFIFSPVSLSGFTVEATFTLDTFSATIPMFDAAGEQVQDATVDASVIAGDVLRTKRRSQMGIATGTQQNLTIEGTVSVPAIDTTFDLSGCFAISQDQHVAFTSQSGPRPGGTVPVNDAPEGAIAIAPGTLFNVRTGAATLEPEVPTSCLPTDEELLFGKTLWYTIEGTGSPVTVDTSGSRFDTAIAIYTKDNGTFTEVACDDDVIDGSVQVSLQSRITFDTELGVTYFVQVGGFAGEFGRLRVKVS